GQAGGAGTARRFLVDHAQLHPDRIGADGDGVVHDRRHLGRAPEDVHDVDMRADLPQAGDDRPPQDVAAGVARIDREEVVALALEVNGHVVAWTYLIGGEPDHGDVARA